MVLLSSESTWSWRIVDQLRECGWRPITVDIAASNCDKSPQQLDYRFTKSSPWPRTRHLRRIATANRIAFGLCLYGGRQAFELLLLKRVLAGFRYSVFAAGSDVLRPPETVSGVRERVLRKPNATALRGAEIVLCNGGHIADGARALAGRSVNAVLWYQGIATEEDGPSRVHTGRGPVSIIAPRPWLPVYNNRDIVHGLLELSRHLTSTRVRVRFVGPGIGIEDQGLIKSLNSQSDCLSVSWQDGYDPATRWSMFAEGDVVASMSRSDGIANAVVEAAYSGCIPILSDIPANRMLLDNLELEAYLVPLGDSHAFSDGILRLLDQRPNWSGASQRNRATIAKHLSSAATTGALCEHLSEFRS